jgi:phosphoglycerol transferase MdoB-like AlkP superfamily enzyme
MARMKKQDKELQKMNRYFMIAKVFLAMTPLICYLYVSLKASMNGITFQQLLSQDPSTTVVFLIAMINPYIAYLVQLIQKNLIKGNTKFVCINMILLLVAQMLTMNLFYLMMLLYVFYRAIKYYNIPVLVTLKNSTIKQSFVNGGGSMLVMLVSCISLFATIRLM